MFVIRYPKMDLNFMKRLKVTKIKDIRFYKTSLKEGKHVQINFWNFYIDFSITAFGFKHLFNRSIHQAGH